MISMGIEINKRFAAISLAVLLSVSCFAGCSKGSSSGDYNADLVQNDYTQLTTSDTSNQIPDDGSTDLDKIDDNTLSDGFWIATEEKNADNPNDVYECIAYDYGFVFTPKNRVKEKDINLYNLITEEYDGIVLTAKQHIWFYKVNEYDVLEIYKPYDSGKHKLMFTGLYDEAKDEMYLYFTDTAEKYYDTSETGSSLILTHYKNSSQNNVRKKLVFETWATISPDVIRSHYSDFPENLLGYEDNDAYSEMREDLCYIDPDVQIFTFYYNYHEFDLSEGNAKATRMNGEEWAYKAQSYRILSDLERIEITPYEDTLTSSYVTDKDMNKLVLENQEANKTIYRLTDFTG